MPTKPRLLFSISSLVILLFDSKILFYIKYLGCVLNFKLCEDLDIDLSNVSFNRSFVFIFRKFNSVSIDVFCSLFHSYFLSFYGIELWIKMKSTGNFKVMSISYHAAIKRMLASPKGLVIILQVTFYVFLRLSTF